ncbi:MAG: hypothetical protein K8F34_08710 [Candidatus Kuenenia stuttgartiensis]|nr:MULTISPECIES: hypothetical protein [Kuenenia]MBE7547418.1 hypothetical protein [Planctomycetia bacterium]MBZ0191755.1 hypothetical protein [Candidatus Kuenenia stuttgartiensis]MCL4727895.1 hypothetical protein [Candidatus Kuenenia stuttgartiensis]MCZ7623769.1 hypothetical protein [Candidatus Kuenenia sp.]
MVVLSHSALATFKKWFYRFDAEECGRQIEEDILAWKLDKLAEKSIGDQHGAGVKKQNVFNCIYGNNKYYYLAVNKMNC